MNRKEYLKSGCRNNCYCKFVHDLMHSWKIKNGIVGTCDVHHRDDTDEVRVYNEEHYELWGFNEDGTFEYGKYIVFISHEEHSRHHNTGKILSDSTREKMSNSAKNRVASDETRHRISESHLGSKNSFYGRHHTKETRLKISNSKRGSDIPTEVKLKMSASHTGVPLSDEHKQKINAAQQRYLEAYYKYKNAGGTLVWNQFRKAVAAGEIDI